MIDITVDDKRNIIEVDMARYWFTNQDEMVVLLTQLIHKVKYSGESINLYKAEGDKKRLIEQW